MIGAVSLNRRQKLTRTYAKRSVQSDDECVSIACAVIELAVKDYKAIKSSSIRREIDENSARAFLRGDSKSLFAFWCEVAGVNRTEIQRHLFK